MSITFSLPKGAIPLRAAFDSLFAEKRGIDIKDEPEWNAIRTFHAEFVSELESGKHTAFAQDNPPLGRWMPVEASLFHRSNLPKLAWKTNQISFSGSTVIVDNVMVVLAVDGGGGNKKPGRKPEIRPAIVDAFERLRADAHELALVQAMSQEMRRRWVGRALGLADDELPSRSYVQKTWTEWLSSLPQIK